MLKDTIIAKLDTIAERYEEVQGLLSQPEVVGDQEKFRTLSKEYADLESMVKVFREYQTAVQDARAIQEMLESPDEEMRLMAEEEAPLNAEKIAQTEKNIQIMLLPRDPKDDSNAFLEIRAGTGGDEAALFAGDLFRLYSKYAEKKGWSVEIMSESPGEMGGYKEIICKVNGEGVYGIMKFESGGHRVQRVPVTETQGRVHTSACTVMVFPEVPESEAPKIDPKDIRIDTFRSSGAGGQHINKTDSAIRITHFPSGIVVECQDERSQHRNKEKAFAVLAARLARLEEEKRAQEKSEERQSILSSGERSDRIRTYNYPQGRVSDHRINLTLYRLDEIMNGDLDALVLPVIEEHQAAQLAELARAG
ncbi:MAG: peptide chain release factor 1 [Succinimonas sp.]|jgi:peptide chain release factor 1|nr:peptide chain release factor 1 [Succinimonas sp.]MEE3421690.1 peptide chain release factor 1 [Succinimonas sp.]